jgi:dTDP-glucose 4,6-dehydratase
MGSKRIGAKEYCEIMSDQKTILITGGAGFIGSTVVRQYIDQTEIRIINVDNLTYAGNLDSLSQVEKHPRYIFKKADICDGKAIEMILSEYQPDAIMHLAAESHVDRSIEGPSDFIQTNIVGTYVLLEASLKYWHQLESTKKINSVFSTYLQMKFSAA